MKSAWSDKDASEYVARYAANGINRDIALRVYTTRLLGRDPLLVLHGGGNTSVKTSVNDLLGDAVKVLCVKGSGWDMAAIEPQGLPAVRLDPLLRLRVLDRLSDEDMVAFQRANLLDPSAPNPSVETLLHAFLPHAYIDHTHSTAVLSVTDQENDEPLLHEVYGGRVALVPYVKPGFDLSQAAARIYAWNPKVEGMILRQHGIFSFGATAQESYERMVGLVTLAEQRLASGRKPVFAAAALPATVASAAEVAPVVRGLLALRPWDVDGEPERITLAFRTSQAIRQYVDGAELSRYSQVGVVTPDHTIRTKNWPLILPMPEPGLAGFSVAAWSAVDEFRARYHAYFVRHNGKREAEKRELDPYPRVVLVPGLGLFGVGRSPAAAHIAADIAENTVRVITDSEAIGRYRPVSEADMFDMEYWSLEQAKLGKAKEPPLGGQVAVITGGGSGIGAATAHAFHAEGAAVVVLDRDGPSAAAVAKPFKERGLALACDVTEPDLVRAAFDRVCTVFGGVDIVVSNAGAAWQGKIGELSDRILRESFELNFFSHQTVAQNAVRVMLAQGTGGSLLFNVSKQALNPGPNFGPYGLPKAALLLLMKQYALEYGDHGIRSNAVNADRVRTNLMSPALMEERAAARGLTVEEYLRDGNLLKREVKADDVAQAFVSLAKARRTTGATITVDGGNIAASLR
ncbi:MAG: bifunctional aldolase/short-chain dehydrogenase [Alphaproteobacteria bacterium]|nr:bifunctional aldolase/short-chain dehydrogenase [Alphaproteobacteria bacterium]